MEEEKGCFVCGKLPAKVCARCRRIRYCSRECQKSDYKEHKKGCFAPITENTEQKQQIQLKGEKKAYDEQSTKLFLKILDEGKDLKEAKKLLREKHKCQRKKQRWSYCT